MVEGGGIEKQSLTREQIFAAMDRQFEKFVGWHIDGIRQRMRGRCGRLAG
jgi:hypothetical protein